MSVGQFSRFSISNVCSKHRFRSIIGVLDKSDACFLFFIVGFPYYNSLIIRTRKANWKTFIFEGKNSMYIQFRFHVHPIPIPCTCNLNSMYIQFSAGSSQTSQGRSWLFQPYCSFCLKNKLEILDAFPVDELQKFCSGLGLCECATEVGSCGYGVVFFNTAHLHTHVASLDYHHDPQG